MTYELGVMVYVCRLSYSRGWDRGTSGAREIADSLGNIPRSCSHNKKAPNHTSTSPGQKEVEDGYQIGMSVDCGVLRTMTKTSQINYLQEKFEVDYLSVCLSTYLFEKGLMKTRLALDALIQQEVALKTRPSCLHHWSDGISGVCHQGPLIEHAAWLDLPEDPKKPK